MSTNKPQRRNTLQWPLAIKTDASIQEEWTLDKSISTHITTSHKDSQCQSNKPDNEMQSMKGKRECTPIRLIAPAAPGEDTSIDYMRQVSLGDRTSNELFKETEDGLSKTSNASNRPRRVSMATLDPAERKAKQKAALQEAKLVAKNIRKQNRSSQKLNANCENGSVSSKRSNESNLTHNSAKPKKGAFIKNLFNRKSKGFEVANPRTGD